MARRTRIAILYMLLAIAPGFSACGAGSAPWWNEKKEPEASQAEQPPPAAEQEPEQTPQEGDAVQQVAEQDTSPEPEKAPPPPPPPPEPVPYEQAFPEDFKSIPPVRIGVLSSPNRPGAGQQFAMMLSGVKRRRLELKLRKPIKIAFISRSKKRHKPITQIHYRPDFFLAAIQVAGAMPNKQNLAPMTEVELKREEVDIFVYMGAGAR